MKFLPGNRRRGNGLIVAVLMTAVIGIDIASYLRLVRQQNLANLRSMTWNYSVAVAEAGIEEALAQLNRNGSNFNNQTWNVATEGWAAAGTNYFLSRTNFGFTRTTNGLGAMNNSGLGSINADVRFAVSFSSNVYGPIITATGFVNLASLDQPATWVRRAIRIRTTNAPLFAKSLVARNDIDIHGNNFYSDSFDSTNPLYSTNGLYTPSKRRDNGDVATNSGLTNSLNVGNADIYGKASTGPGGSLDIGNNGVVGTASWIAAGNKGVQPGRFTDDMNIAFPAVKPPFTSGSTPGGGVAADGTNYTYIIPAGNSYFGSISLSGHQKITVTGHAVVYVNGDFSMSGQSYIYIAPGASLKVYCNGDFDLTGQGLFNSTGLAINLQLYGTPNCTDLKIAGNGGFIGVIYAPDASLMIVGNGDVSGAIVCKEAQLTGNGSFHYDESLGRVGPSKGYVPVDWAEL